MVVCMLIPMLTVFVSAADEPVVTVDNYTVTVTNAEMVRPMDFAFL